MLKAYTHCYHYYLIYFFLFNPTQELQVSEVASLTLKSFLGAHEMYNLRLFLSDVDAAYPYRKDAFSEDGR